MLGVIALEVLSGSFYVVIYPLMEDLHSCRRSDEDGEVVYSGSPLPQHHGVSSGLHEVVIDPLFLLLLGRALEVYDSRYPIKAAIQITATSDAQIKAKQRKLLSVNRSDSLLEDWSYSTE